MLNLPRKGQTLSAKRKPQTVNELAAKDLPEDFDGEEEGILGTNPLRVIRPEPSAWNDTVEMRMASCNRAGCLRSRSGARLRPDLKPTAVVSGFWDRADPRGDTDGARS
jgi:hypothetical protein